MLRLLLLLLLLLLLGETRGTEVREHSKWQALHQHCVITGQETLA